MNYQKNCFMQKQEILKVASFKGGLSAQVGWTDITCDRATVLGNPFDMGNQEQLRPLVCAAFREYLWLCIHNKTMQSTLDPLPIAKKYGVPVSRTWKRPSPVQIVTELKRLVQLLNTGQKLRLLCWCHPKECHAQVIGRCLLWLLKIKQL